MLKWMRVILVIVIVCTAWPDYTIQAQENDTQRALELRQQGVAFYHAGQYAEALAAFEEALAIYQQLGDRAGEGQTLNNIGAVYGDQGQYAQALDYYTQALEIQREVSDRASEGTTLHNMGGVYYDQGQYTAALDHYTQALEIRREVGDRAGEGITLIGIGMVHCAQGQYAAALDYHTQALIIARGARDRAGEGAALYNIGIVYHYQGQYTQALDNYTQALAAARETGYRRGEGRILYIIGTLWRDQRQYELAQDYLNQALSIQRAIGDRAGEGITLESLGTVYTSLSQPLRALISLTQALVIAREIGDRLGQERRLLALAPVYGDLGQFTVMLDTYTQALAIAYEIGDRVGEIVILSHLATAYETLGRTADAITDYQADVEVIESLISDAALDSAVASLSTRWNSRLPYRRLAVLLAQQGDFESALNYAERGRATLIRTDLTTGAIDFRAGLDKTLLEQEAVLRLAVNDAQNLLDSLRIDASATDTDIQNAQAMLDDARQAYEDHLATMQLQGGFLARQISRQVATLAQIQAALPADTTLVLYAVGYPNSVVFLITADSLDSVVLDVADDTLTKQVTTFGSDRRTNVDTLSTLYDLVVAPIADQITTSHLIIVPDGALNYVPFAALQTPDGSYLIDHYSVSMVSSGTTLVLLNDRAQQTQAAPTSPALVLAQPAAPGLPTLRNAPLEALEIADLLRVEPHLNATEANLRAQATGSTVLYITAHAELDRFAPLFSVIYLGEGGDYDGRLEVREIYELDLSQGTELVVLSGCETASGGDGEDFGLLARAFFAAGSPRVIASLWAVDDAATAELMTAFMRERTNYTNEAAALRAAMLTTRENYPEPYFWAGFVLSGLP
jgi:CHAT domain-containing protein/Tfp pilus assembly protein PilF